MKSTTSFRLGHRLAFLLYLAPVLIFCALSAREVWESDTWWHLKTGELIFTQHQIPRTDPFSPANAGKPWVNFEWLSQLVFYLLYRLAGPAGLVLGSMLTLGLALTAFARVGLERQKPLLGAGLLALSVLAASGRFVVRPEIFSYLLLGVFFLILHQYRLGKLARGIWALPLLQVLWENLHGGTWLGIVTVGAYIAGMSWLRFLPVPDGWKTPDLDAKHYRRLLSVLAAVLLASLVNPWGWATLFTIFKTQAHHFTMMNVAEWQRTYALSGPWPFWLQAYGLGAALGVLGFVLNWRRLELNHWFLFLGFLFISLLAVRNTALLALVALPITARNFSLAGQDLRLSARLAKLKSVAGLKPAARAAAMAGLALGCLGFSWWVMTDRYYIQSRSSMRFGWGRSEILYPWAMLDFLARSGIPGPLFNDHDLGGFLIWSLWPRYRPFLDSRAVLYDPDYLEAYAHAINDARDWRQLAQTQGFQVAAFLHTAGGMAPLVGILAHDPEWAPVYLDENGVVFVRNLPANAEFISRHRLNLTDLSGLTWAAPRPQPARRRLWFLAAPDPAPEIAAALFYLNAGYPAPAEDLLRQAWQLDPTCAWTLSNLAAVELKREKWAEAEAWSRRAIAEDPRLPSAQAHLGDALLRQKRWPESLAAYDASLKLDPEVYEVSQNRGVVLAELRRYREAAEELERAASLRPDQALPRCNLAQLYDLLHDSRAAEDWKQCLIRLERAGDKPELIRKARARLGKERSH